MLDFFALTSIFIFISLWKYNMSKYLCIIFPILIAAYLYSLWSDWFTTAELNDIAKETLYSKVLELDKAGTVVWTIEPERLSFAQGLAKLSLALNINTMLELPRERDEIALRVKVSVEGRKKNNPWENRLVRDWYFKTDEPFSPAGKGLGTSFGYGRFEYVLAGVNVVPDEAIRISLNVQIPDGFLMTGHPRLKLKFGPGHNYAPFFRCAYRNLVFFSP